jgi:hypothetical protein
MGFFGVACRRDGPLMQQAAFGPALSGTREFGAARINDVMVDGVLETCGSSGFPGPGAESGLQPFFR